MPIALAKRPNAPAIGRQSGPVLSLNLVLRQDLNRCVQSAVEFFLVAAQGLVAGAQTTDDRVDVLELEARSISSGGQLGDVGDRVIQGDVEVLSDTAC